MQRPEQNDCIQFGDRFRTEFGMGQAQPDVARRNRPDQCIPGVCTTEPQRHLYGGHQSERSDRLTPAVLIYFCKNKNLFRISFSIFVFGLVLDGKGVVWMSGSYQ